MTIILLVVVGFVVGCRRRIAGRRRAPVTSFGAGMRVTPVGRCGSPSFNCIIGCPYFFRRRSASMSKCRNCTHFSFAGRTGVVLRDCIAPGCDGALRTYTSSLTRGLRSREAVRTSSGTFVLSNPICRGKMEMSNCDRCSGFVGDNEVLFICSLACPSDCGPTVPQLFGLVSS